MSEGIKESDTCMTVGWAIMAIGGILGLIVIFFFGRVEIGGGIYSEAKKVWSPIIVGVGMGTILNGLIVGYLFQKIASILKYHEKKS